MTLQPPPNLDEQAFADLCRVTKQTVSNHVRAGNLTPARTEPYRGGRVKRYYTPEQAKDFVARFGHPDRGGKRRGAGRPKRPGPLPSNAIEAATLAQEVRQRTENPEEARGRVITVHDCLYLTEEELLCLTSLLECAADRLSPTQLGALKRLVELRAKNLETNEKLGRLVPAEQIATAWAQECRAVMGDLGGLAARCATELHAILAPSPDEIAQLRDLLRSLGLSPVETQTAIDLVRPPEDLLAACRKVVRDQLDAVMRQMGACRPPTTSNAEAA